MEELYSTYRLLLDRTPLAFQRFLHSRINWNSRLVAILGGEGRGQEYAHAPAHQDEGERGRRALCACR